MRALLVAVIVGILALPPHTAQAADPTLMQWISGHLVSHGQNVTNEHGTKYRVIELPNPWEVGTCRDIRVIHRSDVHPDEITFEARCHMPIKTKLQLIDVVGKGVFAFSVSQGALVIYDFPYFIIDRSPIGVKPSDAEAVLLKALAASVAREKKYLSTREKRD